MFQLTSWDVVSVFIGLVLSVIQDRYERRHKPGRKPKIETIIMKSIVWIILAVAAERILLYYLGLSE